MKKILCSSILLAATGVLTVNAAPTASVSVVPAQQAAVAPNANRIPLNGQAAGQARAVAPAAVSQPASAPAPRVHDLSPSFHRTGGKGGVLSFNLPSSSADVSVTTEGSSVVATIKGYKVPKQGQKRLDVADYGSPVRYVDILPKGSDTRVVVNMGRSAYEYVTYQNGRTYNVEIKQPKADDSAQKARELAGFGSGKRYKGAPLSLNFQDIEVRAVLQIIAEFTNNNIVVSDSVSGNITLRLENVPWDQALDIILKTKGLEKRESGHVIYVAPANEINSAEIAALENYQRKQALQPMNREVIQLKYAKASDLASIIRSSKGTNETGTRDESLLSSRGSVSVDNRTNVLIVQDVPSHIQSIRALVERLDAPVRQVLIDSRIVKTNDDFTNRFGGSFGINFVGDKSGKVWGGGTGDLNGTPVGSPIHTGTGNVYDFSGRLGSNYSNLDSNGKIAFGIIGKEVAVGLELQASQEEGRTEVLSNPKVVTQDGYRASISSGKEIPYTSVSNDGTNVEFKEAELKLDVLPRINPNDRIAMEVTVTKDAASELLVGNEPAIDTSEVKTQVEVDNGETLVLGGIYEQTQSSVVNKVPVLGDIPVIGNAFKGNSKRFSKDELLIFITPRIIDKSLTDYDKFSSLRDN